jgi:prepilin-type N-terminal cleavage/methylation domain-containing protein
MADPSSLSQRKQAARRGFTLIELMIVLFIFTFLLSSVALAIGTLLRAKNNMEDELTRAASLSRLAAQLRTDSHLALSVEAINPEQAQPAGFRLNFNDQKIEYTEQPDRLIRTVYQDEESLHREVFSLAEGTSIEWQLPGESSELLTLAMTYTLSEDAGTGQRTRRIIAIVGMHAGTPE